MAMNYTGMHKVNLNRIKCQINSKSVQHLHFKHFSIPAIFIITTNPNSLLKEGKEGREGEREGGRKGRKPKKEKKALKHKVLSVEIQYSHCKEL
jgi:hypothetical protein